MDPNGNGKRLPKLREISRRQRQDSDGNDAAGEGDARDALPAGLAHSSPAVVDLQAARDEDSDSSDSDADAPRLVIDLAAGPAPPPAPGPPAGVAAAALAALRAPSAPHADPESLPPRLLFTRQNNPLLHAGPLNVYLRTMAGEEMRRFAPDSDSESDDGEEPPEPSRGRILAALLRRKKVASEPNPRRMRIPRLTMTEQSVASAIAAHGSFETLNLPRGSFSDGDDDENPRRRGGQMRSQSLEILGTNQQGNSHSQPDAGETPRNSDAGNRQRNGGGADSPDLEFIYDDSDSHSNEIAELYSYTEQPELAQNVKAFEDQMDEYGLPPSWQRLSADKRKSVVMKLLNQLEVSSKPLRMRAARCVLYIAQGCWAEMQSDAEQQHWARANVMLLYNLGIFTAFTDLLNIEIENSTAAHVAMRKYGVSVADSQDLRIILSVLYTITEVIRNEIASNCTEYQIVIDSFRELLGNVDGDELLIVKLLGMVTRFCSGAAPHFPMKKVLLLLWKLILVSLGGMNVLKQLKDVKREEAQLPALDEDTMEIAKTMRASSPPASASDLLEAQNQKRNTRPFRRESDNLQNLIKQNSLDDHETLGMELDASLGDNGDDLNDLSEYDERRPAENAENQMYNYQNRPASPTNVMMSLPRGLPWKPKVRQKDIDAFLDQARMKFVGYSLLNDSSSLAGLPSPIHEGVKTLKDHIYTALAELQIKKEEEMARNPVSIVEENIEMTPTEILYQAMLPNLPQYMIALLKILLAAASKAKTDSINIMADVLPDEMPMTVLQSRKLGIDVNRHKEIIIKAVSAILLLLLKHFKLNHIYQFEFMSQHLVFANCIPLVLKFFNQNIMVFVGAKNAIPILDFPSCVIGDQPELTAESLDIGDAAPYSWRNMFSCINLLRILNKLTKWKHSRIMMLVVFKSAPILKRTLKVRHAMTQLYVLKLLKMQTKYLGRQWRKSNMKTISAIYSKVRHRLNDDWAYGNDLDAKPWDFQAEECALRASVDRFNNRRYNTQPGDSEFEPVDNDLNSVLGTDYDLSDSFKKHYRLWLEQEVYGTPIEWEKLLLTQSI